MPHVLWPRGVIGQYTSGTRRRLSSLSLPIRCLVGGIIVEHEMDNCNWIGPVSGDCDLAVRHVQQSTDPVETSEEVSVES